MKPLRDEHDPRLPEVARAVRILQAVGPLPRSRLTMRRVRHKIDSGRRSRAALVLRPAMAIGVVCGFAASAAAAWGVIHFTTSAVTRSPVVSAAPPRVTPAARTHSEAPRVPLPPAEPAPAPVEQVRTGRSAAPVRASRASEPRLAAKQSRPVKKSVGSDAALVQGAVKELRSEGDPDRARALLDQYRAENPSGVLAEEALALSIEAAAAKRDPDTKRLARQYLAKYPKGRFVAAARRALRSGFGE